jgi:hypothetical protein
MEKPWETDSCESIASYFACYSVPHAALLWCGISQDDIEEHLALAEPTSTTSERGKSILKHPYIKCLEPRCRAIQDAIDNDKLEVGRDGRPLGMVSIVGQVAYSRRTLNREHLKAWILREFPAEKPSFLFDEIERSTHTSINADSYRALQADRDALKTRLEIAKEAYRTLRQERDTIEGQRASLAAMVEKLNVPGDRAETTYLNIIGGLLALMRGRSPAGVAQSVFSSEAAIISALLTHHSGKPGISSTTLEAKFADAKRSLKAG